MRRAVIVALSVCLLVVVLWPALSMCATYLMDPSAVEADAAAVRYGNGYSLGARVRARRGVRSRGLGEGVLLRGRLRPRLLGAIVSADAAGGRGASGTRAVACLLAAVASLACLGVMLGPHLGGRSLRAALGADDVRGDGERGLTCRIYCWSGDEAGQVRHRPVLGRGGNIPLAITRESRWPDGIGAARRRTGRNCARPSRDGWRGACGRRRPAARGIGGSET